MALVLIKGAETADEKRRARAAEEQLNALVAQMRQIMAKYDTNSDGAISPDELTGLMKDMSPTGEVADDDVKAVFKLSDIDHSGDLKSGEIRKAIQIWGEVLKQRYPAPPAKKSSLCNVL